MNNNEESQMTSLQKARYFYQFWLEAYYRTFSPCAFTQLLRYHHRLAQLQGISGGCDD